MWGWGWRQFYSLLEHEVLGRKGQGAAGVGGERWEGTGRVSTGPAGPREPLEGLGPVGDRHSRSYHILAVEGSRLWSSGSQPPCCSLPFEGLRPGPGWFLHHSCSGEQSSRVS